MLSSVQEKKHTDPRVKRTLKLLNQAFIELLNEKGFQSITVQDIADKAEVNRATFYAHFEDKFDMLDAFARENFLEWLAKNEPAPGELTLKQLSRFVTHVFNFLAKMAAHCNPIDHQVESMLQAAVQEEICRYLLEWFNRTPIQSFPLRQSPESVAIVWSWAIFGAAVQWSRGDMTPSAEQMAGQLVEVLTAPLSPQG
jgi:AcrR family transcriptional regulator